MTKGYVLTAAAEADLREIIRYTRKQWGAAQVRRYIAKLGDGMARFAVGQWPFKDMSALYPTLRMAYCEVFCLPRENAPALIVAIFHERMDLIGMRDWKTDSIWLDELRIRSW